MKKTIYIFLISILSFIIITILVLISNKKESLVFSEERNIIKLKKTTELNLDNKYSQINFYKDNIYLTSWVGRNQGKIFKYNINLNKAEVIKDFKKFVKSDIIIGEYIITDSLIYFKNNSNNTFNKFNIITNELVFSKEFKFMIQRIFFVNEENSLVTTWDEKFTPKYYKYNLEKNTFKDIEYNKNILDGIKYPGIALDGKFSSNNDYIFLTPYSKNFIIKFDHNLNYIDTLNLNYSLPDYNLLYTKNQTAVIDPKNISPNIFTNVDNNYYYVLMSESGNKDDIGTYYIDKYDMNNFKYLTSFKTEAKSIDEIPREFRFNKNKLFILNNKNITIYERDGF